MITVICDDIMKQKKNHGNKWINFIWSTSINNYLVVQYWIFSWFICKESEPPNIFSDSGSWVLEIAAPARIFSLKRLRFRLSWFNNSINFRVFDEMIKYHGSAHISSANLMTCMGCIANIAKLRPEFMSKVNLSNFYTIFFCLLKSFFLYSSICLTIPTKFLF